MTTIAIGTRVAGRTQHGDTYYGRVERRLLGLVRLDVGHGRKPKWVRRSSVWPLNPEPTPMLVATGDPDWGRHLEGRRFSVVADEAELMFPDRPMVPTRDAVFDDRELLCPDEGCHSFPHVCNSVPGLTAQPVPHDGGAALARRHVRAFSPW